MYSVNSLIDLEKKALETTYFDKVDVYRTEEIEVNNITKIEKKEVLIGEPCALSKSSRISSTIDNGINRIEGEHILFISEQLKKGDELLITQEDGRQYKTLAGEPNYYRSHYEIPVLIKERA